MTTIHCFAAHAPKANLSAFNYQPLSLSANQVEVEISHCGICHSDIHLIDNDWGISQYPLVPGHEIIGTVRQLGEQVTHLRLNQRVGIGWQCGACLTCEQCILGHENLCSSNQATCVGHFGGFAHAIRIDSHFAFPVPDALPSAQAAPLLCGGTTVYTPFRVHQITPNMHVGIVGIGGLGHLAIQFARAFGCEVSAFSTSENKENEARSFGAHHFIDTKKAKELKQQYDFILVTASSPVPWENYINALKPNGKLCVVGVSQKPITVFPWQLISENRSICGSSIGSRHMISEMLAFAARHNIQAKIETMPLAEVNHALDKIRRNEARYRMVLQMS